jgi:N-acetyl-anhydromuramyl-L-alanine amidase AmpD
MQSLLPALHSGYPIAHVAGHEHIAPGRKADPGPGMDWTRLQQSVGLSPQYFPDGALRKNNSSNATLGRTDLDWRNRTKSVESGPG